MTQRIRVGVIGANPERGWAATAHLPALTALPEYEITAVATSRPESAALAAQRYGASHAFTDPARLSEHPDVDLVVVAVKTPDHAGLVRPALAAGKHVFCEWPLARTTKEAEALTEAARAAGVHHAVGLQARYAPAARYARELLTTGHIGRITGVNVYAARGKGAAGTVPANGVYTLDQRNGAGTLEVAGGHTLDLLTYLAGPIGGLSATLSVQRPRLTVAETSENVTATSPDHLVLGGTLVTGAPVSVQIHDGKTGDARTRLEFSGTLGNLAVTSEGPGAAHGIQVSEIHLYESGQAQGGGWTELHAPGDHRLTDADVPGTAVLNVAQLHAALAQDIGNGTRTVPDFGTGLRLHELLDTVRTSDMTATRRRTREQGP